MRIPGLIQCLVALWAFFACLGTARAGDYPAKPIRLIVPFAPGGSTDVVARTLAQKLGDSFGTSVVVDNRGGGGGMIGTEVAVRAAADGYTLIFVSGSYAANAVLYRLPYDPIKDITPISLACETGYLVAVFPGLKVTTPKDLIEQAKARPGALNYGSAGQGSLAHLVTEFFSMEAGIRLTHIPYRGTGPAIVDLIGGQIQLVFGGVPGLIPHHRAGRVRAIGITTAKRLSTLPDIPAISEFVPGFEAPLWFGFWAPKGVSPQIVKRWNTEIDRTMQAGDVQKKMASDGLEAVGGDPGVFLKVLRNDVAKWSKVVKQANIRANR